MRQFFSVLLVLSFVLSGGVAHAGTVEVKQDVFPLFEISAPGVDGLEEPAIATGRYQFQTYAGFPVNTMMTLTPVFDGIHQYPTGLISWKHGREKDQYMFVISAGGYLGSENTMDEYCINVNVNFKDIGKNCTSHTGFWSPTIIEKVAFPKNSRVLVTISSR